MTFSRVAAAALSAAVVFIYFSTSSYGFVNFDASLSDLERRDEAALELTIYVTGNPAGQEAQNVLRSLQQPR